MQYSAIIKRGKDRRWLVSFHDFPEALTDGATLEEAIDEAGDCLEEAIAGRLNRGEVIPPARLVRGRNIYNVDLTPGFVLKVMLHNAWKERGINKSEFARIIGVDEKEARRLLDPRYGSKLPKMKQAFDALGKRIVIGVEDKEDNYSVCKMGR